MEYYSESRRLSPQEISQQADPGQKVRKTGTSRWGQDAVDPFERVPGRFLPRCWWVVREQWKHGVRDCLPARGAWASLREEKADEESVSGGLVGSPRCLAAHWAFSRIWLCSWILREARRRWGFSAPMWSPEEPVCVSQAQGCTGLSRPSHGRLVKAPAVGRQEPRSPHLLPQRPAVVPSWRPRLGNGRPHRAAGGGVFCRLASLLLCIYLL